MCNCNKRTIPFCKNSSSDTSSTELVIFILVRPRARPRQQCLATNRNKAVIEQPPDGDTCHVLLMSPLVNQVPPLAVTTDQKREMGSPPGMEADWDGWRWRKEEGIEGREMEGEGGPQGYRWMGDVGATGRGGRRGEVEGGRGGRRG